jgi:hypothetical protein
MTDVFARCTIIALVVFERKATGHVISPPYAARGYACHGSDDRSKRNVTVVHHIQTAPNFRGSPWWCTSWRFRYESIKDVPRAASTIGLMRSVAEIMQALPLRFRLCGFALIRVRLEPFVIEFRVRKKNEAVLEMSAALR